jgi:hypothetical protein
MTADNQQGKSNTAKRDLMATAPATPDEALVAFGALVGALTFAPPEHGVMVTMDLARRAEDPPRLYVRFHGRLPDVYEVTIARVPQPKEGATHHDEEG